MMIRAPYASLGPDSIMDLDDLWAHVEELTRAVDPDSALPPVMGGGETNCPRLALVFINPTHRNASTRVGWTGPRLPFIGTKAVWGVLANAGLLPGSIVDEVAAQRTWDEAFARRVYGIVRTERLYLTNLVKWTGPNGDLPTMRLVRLYTDILRRELELVRPQAIVAFGGATYRALTHATVRLSDVLVTLRKTGQLPHMLSSEFGVPIYPCYFPVGRGNPKGAVEILTALAR